MHVVEVIPLVRGTQAESLSYYSSQEYKNGTVLKVPVRNRIISAVVTDSKPVSRAKTALKAATFSLKKINHSNDQEINHLPKNLMDTVTELSNIYPASAGAILYALLPPDVRTGIKEYPNLPEAAVSEDPTPSMITGVRSERFLVYKSYIREAFAHRGSVLFVVPNSSAVERAKKELEQGIEKRVVTFSSAHTRKQLEKSYDSFCDLSNAKLIITTPNYALLNRHDLTHIVIDESSTTHYKSRIRPYLDARTVLKTYAKVSKKALLLGDILPLASDEALRREDTYQTQGSHTKRLSFPSSFEIAEFPQKTGEKEFELITPGLFELMQLSLRNKGRVFLFAARKGLAPLVTCFDCGYIFRCNDSGAPYSLWRKKISTEEEERWFICSTSGKKVRAADVCPNCNSWRLREQGVGIQKVEDRVKELFPKYKVIRFDHETASTHNKAKRLIENFYAEKGVILIGTQMTLPYIDRPVDVTAVTSYEALRAVPTWRAEEITLHTLLSLRGKTLKDCVVQTRSEPDSLLKLAKQGLIDKFYDEEIAIREALKYPPYATFILLTYTGNKNQVQENEALIEQYLVGYNLQSYNSPSLKPDQITRNTLVRVLQEKWPDKHLMDSLKNLPPNIKIEINPEKIV